jgi:hypothetical protein
MSHFDPSSHFDSSLRNIASSIFLVADYPNLHEIQFSANFAMNGIFFC